jgi:hypothetical protein
MIPKWVFLNIEDIVPKHLIAPQVTDPIDVKPRGLDSTLPRPVFWILSGTRRPGATVMIHQQEQMIGIMKELLGENYVQLEVVGYDLHEDFGRGETSIACKIVDTHSNEVTVIEGRGVGIIDAFFHGLLDHLSRDYPSLQSISVDKFTVTARIGAEQGTHSDAECEVVIGIKNDKGIHFEFETVSRSVTRAGIHATMLAAEYFVNSERAFIEAYKGIKSARDQNRQDMANRYTELMSALVRNTSYSEVIEQIRAEMEIEDS